MFRILTALTLFCGIISCQSEKSVDLTSYYFPMSDQSIDLRYEYVSIADSTRPNEIWNYRRTDQDGKKYMIGTNFDLQGRPMQINREEIVTNGSLLRDLKLIDYDTAGIADTITALIEGNNVFPFQVKDSSDVFYYKVGWTQKPDGIKIGLTRNRRYLGKTKFVYNNNEVDCARFLLRELLITDQEGQSRTQWSGEEWYAKGIGLVYYKKDISPAYKLEYKLLRTN